MKLSTMSIQRFDLLVSIYIFCLMASEIFGAKTFPLVNIFGFQLNASVAIFVFPLLYTINDVVVEVYGKERAISIVRSGFVVIFLLFLFTLLAISLPPSARFAPTEEAYQTVFAKSARISAASLIAFAVAAFLDVMLFAKLRKRMHKKALWFRNNASNFSAQFVDTILFMTLAFYAFNQPFSDNASFLISLIIPYWLLKCAMSVAETPLVYLGVKWLKKT